VINKLQIERPWAEIASELLMELRSTGLKPSELATAIGVNHQAIRRMLAGQLENRTENAERACHYFQISLNKSDKSKTITETDILNSIRTVWNGTPEHAALIIRLIQATEGLA
jgi:hypothetical protein